MATSDRRAARTAICLLLVLVAAGCRPAGEGAGRVTLGGRVTAGPVCPVEPMSPDPSCADRPVAGAVLLVQGSDGHRVAEVTSGADGAFEVALEPGSYRLVPQPVEGLMGTAPTVDVTVVAGASPEELNIGYDTGIR